MESTKIHLARIVERIAGFGKENLEEILHGLAEGIKLVAGRERIRIYLEDLTRGALSCAYASGPSAAEIAEVTFPIVSSGCHRFYHLHVSFPGGARSDGRG